ncbi:MAG: hypothetical protein V9G12_06115 [Microthrixaceae bacterium]
MPSSRGSAAGSASTSPRSSPTTPSLTGEDLATAVAVLDALVNDTRSRKGTS